MGNVMTKFEVKKFNFCGFQGSFGMDLVANTPDGAVAEYVSIHNSTPGAIAITSTGPNRVTFEDGTTYAFVPLKNGLYQMMVDGSWEKIPSHTAATRAVVGYFEDGFEIDRWVNGHLV